MKSIIKEIEQRTNENPDKLLYVFLDVRGNVKESYTYRSFDHRSKCIAAHIHAHYELVPGDRVLLAYPPGLEMICAFFACVRLGLIPVPVYPPSAQSFEASFQKMNFIADDCEAKAILTDRTYYWSFKINSTKYNSESLPALQWIVSEDADIASAINFPEAHSEILFLQYTSGSTNNPKGVMVTHENTLQNCQNVVDHLPIGVSWLPQYHDMGLIGYYIFFAISGGTTYGFSPIDFMQRPALWLETITKYKGTASSAPNFAYEYCLVPGKIPESTFETLNLSSLKFLMTAAEPINPQVYQAFLKKFEPYGLNPDSFFAAYGLAEFTLAVTNYGRKAISYDATLLKQNWAKALPIAASQSSSVSLMSCGKALNDTRIKIVDVDNGYEEVADGRVGEIWLNGASKCKGYWNRPNLTKETFEAEINGDPLNEKWLRTGDLGFLYEDELFVCGRKKDLIIIRGLNYYPQDIEAIVEEDPLIRKGCVAAFTIDKEGKEALIIVAGLKSPVRVPDAEVIQHKMIQYLGISASEIVFVPARTITKTSSGKIMRYDSKNKFLKKELQPVLHVILDHQEINECDANQVTEQEISNADEAGYQSLLRRYKLTGFENAALGDAGLDSMKLAEFAHDLKAYIVDKEFEDLAQEVDLKLLQKIAVSQLVDILKALDSASRFARFKFKKAFSAIRLEFERSEAELMKRDADFNVDAEEVTLQSKPANTKGHILLTGGTGFFGPFLIKSLLEQTEDDIYVLIRADSPAIGLNRLQSSFKTIHAVEQLCDSFKKRIKIVCGDLSKTRLGVSDADWEFLSENIHTIYHNGAWVNYLADYESMRHINVGGTKEIVRLALHSRAKQLNYISTTFIFGWSVKETLYESDSNQAMELLDFGYSQSKWVADQVVLKAMDNGLQARIFRPALIAPSIDGEGYNFDISIRLLAFMLKYGIGTSAPNQVSFTPADIAANNIVAISNMESNIGKTFHVTRDEYSSMQEVTTILGTLAGKTFKNYALHDFVPEVVSRCKKDDLLFPLLNFLVGSVDNISAMEFKRYDNSNYRKFRSLSPWGKEDPPLEEVVKGIFQFMKNNNLITSDKQ
jgi:thioester reductase-like protein